MCPGAGHGLFGDGFQFGRLDLVGLGKHQAIAHRSLIQHLHHLVIDILEAVTRIDEDERPLQHRTTAQIVVHKITPFADNILGRLGESVAGHVDEPQHDGFTGIEKLSSCVRPGVLDVRARLLRLVNALSNDDLPTLERPANATSG